MFFPFSDWQQPCLWKADVTWVTGKGWTLESREQFLQNTRHPFVRVTGVLPRATEPLQSARVKGLFGKAAFQSVSGTCSKWCITWRCIIYAIVLWGLCIPTPQKRCNSCIYFFPLPLVKYRHKDVLEAEMLAELYPVTRVLYIKQKRFILLIMQSEMQW